MALTTVQGELLESGSALENIGAGGITPSYLSTQSQYTGFKNRIINGAMMIDQRNAGAAVTTAASGTFGVDRFKYESSPAAKFTIQQNAGSVTPPVGFKNYLGFTTTSAYSVGAGDLFYVTQQIEGYNVADLGWGTASAKTVTLSFQVYSSLTGTFGGAISNSAQNRSYPFNYTISVANTWTSISVTIAGDTSGTWLTTNGNGMYVFWSLGTGTTYSGTAGSWAGTQYVSATGATSVVGTNGATFYITGVQLEKGSTATSFDYRPYGTELQLCQRYCKIISFGNDQPIPSAFTFVDTTSVQGDMMLTPTMRTTPTIAQTATSYRVNSGSLNQTATTTVTMTSDSTPNSIRLSVAGFTGATSGQGALIRISGSGSTTYFGVTAEL